MADKTISNSNIGGDTKNKKLKGSCKVETDEASLSSEFFDKGLEISFKKPNEIKAETDFEMLNNMFNKSTPLNIRSLRKAPAPASTPRNTIVKKENITNEKAEEKNESKVSTYNPTPIKPANALNVQISEGNDAKSENQESADENTNEANVIRLTAKNLSIEERKKLRAKRFNIVDEFSQGDERTFTNTVPKHVFGRTNILGNNPTPTYNILKKRAERFGENVSSVMKSLEHKEKMLKRKLKFLESVTNLQELEVNKARPERFGLA